MSNSKKEPEQKKIKITIPKNVNDYRHIIKSYGSRESDVSWILELRGYGKSPRHIPKEINTRPPDFYDADLEKYKKRFQNSDRRFLKTNIANYYHIIDNPAGQPINNSLYSFETTLRDEVPSPKIKTKRVYKQLNLPPWKSVIVGRNKNLFGTFLPPVLSQSKDNLKKILDECSRPVEEIKTETNLNGEKVKQRKFEYSNSITLRSPTEHFPSSKYSNTFRVKNLNAFAHIMKNDNINATSIWGTNLREYGAVKTLGNGNENKRYVKKKLDKL